MDARITRMTTLVEAGVIVAEAEGAVGAFGASSQIPRINLRR